MPSRSPASHEQQQLPESLQEVLEESIAHSLIERFSEGNVCLMMGWYLTDDDVEAMRQDVLHHDFNKP